MRRFLKRMILAFSMYSRIPMPQLAWQEDDMPYSLGFFPLVGAVIGGLICLLDLLPVMREIPVAVRIPVTILIPIAVTGGFHLDGFMDVEDALRSYASREKRLEIMKDPHIGAFAVIGLVRILLLSGTAVTAVLLEEENTAQIVILAGIFVSARCLSGLSSLLFRKAKREGMLAAETGSAPRTVIAALCMFLVMSAALAVFMDPVRGTVCLAALFLSTILYRFRSYRLFGGVTGDTAGHFLVTAETMAACALAVAGFLIP